MYFAGNIELLSEGRAIWEQFDVIHLYYINFLLRLLQFLLWHVLED